MSSIRVFSCTSLSCCSVSPYLFSRIWVWIEFSSKFPEEDDGMIVRDDDGDDDLVVDRCDDDDE